MASVEAVSLLLRTTCDYFATYFDLQTSSRMSPDVYKQVGKQHALECYIHGRLPFGYLYYFPWGSRAQTSGDTHGG